MDEIKLYDIISSEKAETPEQGDKVYEKISTDVQGYIESNKKFCFDFSKISYFTTAFLNNCIGKIIMDNKGKKVQGLMLFKGFSNSTQIETLKHSLSNAIALSRFE